MDQFWCWIHPKYNLILIIFLLLYVVGAFLAPVLMRFDLVIPAKIVYGIYSTTCHQFAFRSWFLFGEQYFYPRELAGFLDVQTYEQISNLDPSDLFAARDYVGSDTVGYKIALCQRDVAIFLALALSGVYFALRQRKLQPISILFWVLIGMLPIALDGLTQMVGSEIPFLSFLPVRESNPVFRTATGFLFGWTTGLYLFPKLEYALNLLKQNANCKET